MRTCWNESARAHLGGAKLRDADRVIAELAGADTERVTDEGPTSDR